MAQILSPRTFHRNENRMRVLLISQHDRLRCRLIAVLSSLDRFDLVGEATKCEEALRLCRQLRPELIVVDLRAPKVDDLSALLPIHERWPQMQIIVLASFPALHDLRRLHDAGMVHCLFERNSSRKLAGLLRGLFREHPSPPAGNGSDHARQAHPGEALSARERQVLGWMMTGQNSLEIADELGVNELTARFHVQNVLSKLRAVSAQKEAELVAWDRPGLADPAFPVPNIGLRLGADCTSQAAASA